MLIDYKIIFNIQYHSVIFPRGLVHRVENRWGLTKVAAVLLNGNRVINVIYPKTTLIWGHFEL